MELVIILTACLVILSLTLTLVEYFHSHFIGDETEGKRGE